MEIKEKEFVIDIEGRKGIEEKKENTSPGSNKRPQKSLIKFTSGKLQGYNGSNNKGNISSDPTQKQNNIEVMIDKITRETQNEESVTYVEDTQRKDKRKAKNSKKTTKPPLPPNTLTLNAASLKQAKEIYDIKEKRRARMNRINALNKARAEKSGSFALTMTAMIVSIIFFVIIFQGFISEITQSVTTDEASEKGFISVKFLNLASTKILQ